MIKVIYWSKPESQEMILAPEKSVYANIVKLCEFKNKQSTSFTLNTYRSIVIDCFRLAVLSGVIAPHEVEFWHNDEYIGHPDEDGALDSWPKGFCDAQDDITAALIEGSIAKSQARTANSQERFSNYHDNKDS